MTSFGFHICKNKKLYADLDEKALYNKQASDKFFYPRQNVTENFKLKLTRVL